MAVCIEGTRGYGIGLARALAADRPATVTLRQACRARKDLVRHRVAVGNQLRAHLLCAFPAAAGLFSKLQAAGGPAGATLSS